MSTKRKVIDYDATDHAGTETHLSVDDKIRTDLADPTRQLAYTEGFAASSGIRNETAETGGRVKNPQFKDDVDPDRVPDSIEEEIVGLADD